MVAVLFCRGSGLFKPDAFTFAAPFLQKLYARVAKRLDDRLHVARSKFSLSGLKIADSPERYTACVCEVLSLPV